jgi:hypothetical protein
VSARPACADTGSGCVAWALAAKTLAGVVAEAVVEAEVPRTLAGVVVEAEVPRTLAGVVVEAEVPRTLAGAAVAAEVPRTLAGAVVEAEVPRTLADGVTDGVTFGVFGVFGGVTGELPLMMQPVWAGLPIAMPLLRPHSYPALWSTKPLGICPFGFLLSAFPTHPAQSLEGTLPLPFREGKPLRVEQYAPLGHCPLAPPELRSALLSGCGLLSGSVLVPAIAGPATPMASARLNVEVSSAIRPVRRNCVRRYDIWSPVFWSSSRSCVGITGWDVG